MLMMFMPKPSRTTLLKHAWFCGFSFGCVRQFGGC
jgi:hypothetical protein